LVCSLFLAPDEDGIPFSDPVQPGEQPSFVRLNFLFVGFRNVRQYRSSRGAADSFDNPVKFIRVSSLAIPDRGISAANRAHSRAGILRIEGGKVRQF
jgi:hypothetical protein